MAVNAAKQYVIPSGEYLYRGITGEDPGGHPQDVTNIFDTGDGRGSFGSARDSWNMSRLGYGVLDAPEALQAGMLEARGRYLGGPNNASWSDRWNQWNATDVTGPDGRTLFSPVHQTGLRVSQNYGARGDDGNPYEASEGDIFNAFKGVRNNLNQDPWLTPTMALAGMRGLNENSPYARPDPRDYVSTMARAQGGPGQADFYGQRGIDQTDELAGANLRQLSRGIDREAQESLANRLPEVQQMMEAAGLGRSGAGQMQMQQAQGDILNQANRDKNRTMADFTDRESGRRAQAINLASQIGAQGYENYAGRQGQAAMQGIGDQFSMNQANRQNEQALWSKQIDNRYSKNQYDQDALLRSLGMSGDQLDRRLTMQDQGQSGALRDWLGLQADRNQTQSSSLNQYLQLADQYRSIEQERRNQMLSAGMLPFDSTMRIATGTTAPSGPAPARTSPWGAALANGAASLGSQWLAGGGPQQTANDFSQWINS